jgi:NHLM bacteriocin system ABC transporter peptidase/ATP-binding protein
MSFPLSLRLQRPSRVRTPTVLQMEAVECGAAALGIVLGHFGKHVPLEELRVACGVSRNGVNARSIVQAARAYGLIARGYKKEEPEQLRSLPLPLIVFWEFNHFLVVEGLERRGAVHLNDPASGRRTVSAEEFDQGFVGVVLTFAPGPDFQRGGARSRLLPGLRARLRGSEGALAYVVLAGLALVLPGLAIPIFSQIFVDGFLVGGMRSWVAPLLVGLALTALLRAALTGLQRHYLLRLETRLAIGMSARFLWHVLRLPMAFYVQRYGGEIGARVTLNDHVAELLSGRLAITALHIVTAAFFVVLMFWYSPPLTLLGIGIAGLNVAAVAAVARRRADGNQRLLQMRGKLMGTAMVGLQMIETLKATGRETDFFARWSGYQALAANAEQALAIPTRALSVVPPLLFAINTAAILGAGGYLVMQGQMTVGMLVAFQALMAGFLAPVGELVSLGGAFQEVDGQLKRLDDVLKHPPAPGLDDVADIPEPASPKQTGNLELRRLTFGYSRAEPPLIEDFSLTLRPGQRVAIVGGSGSGKSTIARLVAGLYAPWEGEILFDGRPRERVPRAVLLNSLALVDQEIFLFEGTLRENLTLWDETVPEPQMVRAAKDAAIHEEIAARPGGYDGPVAEGGANFSGGQRQRLEIARALVCDPSLLLLDEATSALDSVTERIIDENLRRRGCTCLIIAHRLSTIRDCDEIVVLENGRVVQRGTHAQMARMEGPYARLLETREAKSKPYLEFA